MGEMTELKPCPFCGQHAIRAQNAGHNWDVREDSHTNIGACYGTWYVGCPSGVYSSLETKCEIHPAACWYAELGDAEHEWNKRYGKEEKNRVREIQETTKGKRR